MNERKSSSIAVKAGSWYVISSIIVKAISVISTPIFSRLLTTSEYGEVATFTSWSALLLPLCTLNLTYSIGRAKLDYPDDLDKYIGSMQLFSLVYTGILFIIGILAREPLSIVMGVPNIQYILLLIYLLFTPTIEFVQNGFRYRYKYKPNVIIALYTALGTVLLSLVLILLFNRDNSTLRVIGLVVPNMFLSIVFLEKSIKNKNLSFCMNYWKYGLKISVPLVLHTVCINILAQSDRIFISKYCGKSSVGIYSLVYSYGLMICVVTNAIADGWLPWFHDNYFQGNYSEIKKNVKSIVILGCYIGLACVALAPEAIMILGGEKYIEGIECVPPIVLGVVCQYIYTHYVNIEMHLKKTGYVSLGTILAAAINIILNYIFVPKYGYVSAAYTTLASYIVLIMVHFCITRFILKIKLYNDLFMFGAVAFTAFAAFILNWLYSRNMIRYFFIVMGFISFLVVFRGYILKMAQRYRK